MLRGPSYASRFYRVESHAVLTFCLGKQPAAPTSSTVIPTTILAVTQTSSYYSACLRTAYKEGYITCFGLILLTLVGALPRSSILETKLRQLIEPGRRGVGGMLVSLAPHSQSRAHRIGTSNVYHRMGQDGNQNRRHRHHRWSDYSSRTGIRDHIHHRRSVLSHHSLPPQL